MSGFFHYFFSVIDPTTNLGFSRALPEVLSSLRALPVLLFLTMLLVIPSIIAWIAYLVKPAWIRPPLPAGVRQAEPLVSVVIAGRNESDCIGRCIRAALQCGYENLEVIFVDDHSDDDSVAVARRAALGLTGNRRDADRVRIFPSPRRNGKPSSLNIGIRMARGEFIAIVDADSVIEYGAMQHWILPFANPRVGAVSANIRVLNSTDNLLTRLQELEYALKFTVNRNTQAHLNILNIITGMGGIFRAEIVRRLGGFDTGLGDDTDLSMNLLKQGWKLEFSIDAVVWTSVPKTRQHLWRQRMRWKRNIIKIRLSKHRDMFLLGRYGFANALIPLQLLFVLLLPWVLLAGLLTASFERGPLSIPMLIVYSYWMSLIYTLIRLLIARDLSRSPQAVHLWLLFLYPFYILTLRIPVMYAEFCELFRIGAKHPYVPDHIWKEIPWW
jgi:biofilm PGA synthesis N-glycosyltransferase PgaC